jgi:S1-C subfamily serine protease
VAALLVGEGRVRRAQIGIAGGRRALPPWARAEWGDGDGVEVVEVLPGGPAGAADVRPEDIVVAVDGVRVRSVPELKDRLDGDAVGRAVTLTVLRGGDTRRRSVVPVELGAEPAGRPG